jgi:hydroxypyruvate reductase
LLADLYQVAVTAAAPGPALKAALASRPPESSRRLHLLALGKAALPMAEAAVDVIAAHHLTLAGGLLVTPEASSSPHPLLPVAVGDHPQPGPGSRAAADALAHAVAAVRPADEVWVLLSGGTTALIGAPLPGLDPADISELYRLLLGSGLDIVAMNRIRKRFTRWAGGRLAAALAPAHVKNFTISDVIGDDLASIGSGPCVPDLTRAADVRTALVSAGLWPQVPAPLRDHLAAVERGEAPETPKPDDTAFATTETILIASNRLALEAVCARARILGLEAHLRDASLSGEASIAGRRLAADLLSYDGTGTPDTQVSPRNKDALLVWGGETTVTLGERPGLGGRSQELALAAAQTLAPLPAQGDRPGSNSPPGGRGHGAGAPMEPPQHSRITLLAAGTDGRDGPTDAAGGFADATVWQAIRDAGRDPLADLTSHNSNAALAAGGALFTVGMTGTNVMDVVLGLVRRGTDNG